MPDNYIYWICYLIIINLAAAVSAVSDKRKARKHLRRIPERTLLLIAAAGGSPGMFAAMLAIRHKTRHAKFMLGLPAMMIAQTALACLIVRLS